MSYGRYQVRTLRIVPTRMVVDLLCVTHAPEKIRQYGLAMRRGESFPPIAVLRLGGRYIVVDGHKRFSAYRSLSRASIPVEIWSVARCLEDQWLQFVRNLGRKRTLLLSCHRNPRNFIRLLNQDFPHWRRVALSLMRRLAGQSSPLRKNSSTAQ